MKKLMILIAILFSSALTVFCDWSPVGANMTAQQKADFINWVKVNGITEQTFFDSLYKDGAVVGTRSVTNCYSTPLKGYYQREAKKIAVDASIQKSEVITYDMDSIDSKLVAWISSGSTEEQRLSRLYKAARFQDALIQIWSVDSSGDSITTNIVSENIYGPSTADQLGLPQELTLQDYEQAVTK